jgi:hypothetical protein
MIGKIWVCLNFLLGVSLARCPVGERPQYSFLKGHTAQKPDIGPLPDSWLVYGDGVKQFETPLRFKAYAFPGRFADIVRQARKELPSPRWKRIDGKGDLSVMKNQRSVRTVLFAEQVPNGRAVFIEEDCSRPAENGGTISTGGSYCAGWVGVVVSGPTRRPPRWHR